MWEDLQATFVAGGVGYPDGRAWSGLKLLVWRDGDWREVARDDFGLDAHGRPSTGILRWMARGTAGIGPLIFGPQETINFALAPVATNGTGIGRVVADYAEVRLRYRICDHPTPEVCDGLDNDCDGETDEDFAPPAGFRCPDVGICEGYGPVCDAGGNWHCPVPEWFEPEETVCDGLDNDCDGLTDEGCQ